MYDYFNNSATYRGDDAEVQHVLEHVEHVAGLARSALTTDDDVLGLVVVEGILVGTVSHRVNVWRVVRARLVHVLVLDLTNKHSHYTSRMRFTIVIIYGPFQTVTFEINQKNNLTQYSDTTITVNFRFKSQTSEKMTCF